MSMTFIWDTSIFLRQSLVKLDPWPRYIPPPKPKKCFIGLRSRASLPISALSGRQGRYAHAYGFCAPFYWISLKRNYGGGYNTARGPILRDIAPFARSIWDTLPLSKTATIVTFHIILKDDCSIYFINITFRIWFGEWFWSSRLFAWQHASAVKYWGPQKGFDNFSYVFFGTS